MIQLQRVTTEYVDAEDRVRLSAAAADGAAVQLWLTQRMLNRLLPHLFGWLERQAGGSAHAGMMQEFAQHAARQALEPQPRVATSDGACLLVHEVDVRQGESAVAMTFKVLRDSGEKEVVGTCTLEVRPLRQWLSIVGDQYAKAEWPRTAWPAWLSLSAVAIDSAQLH